MVRTAGFSVQGPVEWKHVRWTRGYADSADCVRSEMGLKERGRDVFERDFGTARKAGPETGCMPNPKRVRIEPGERHHACAKPDLALCVINRGPAGTKRSAGQSERRGLKAYQTRLSQVPEREDEVKPMVDTA